MVKPLSTKNYQISKAEVFFQPEGGEEVFQLGDSNTVSLEFDVSEIERITREKGLGLKVLEEVTSIDASLSLELAQLTDVNRALHLMGEEVKLNQSAVTGETVSFTQFRANTLRELGFLNIDPNSVSVVDSSDATITYQNGTNYEVDYQAGKIKLLSHPSGASEDVEVTFDTLQISDRPKIGIANISGTTGKLTVRGNSQVGLKTMLVLPRVQLRPDGERSFVAEDEFTTISLTGTVLVDSSVPDEKFQLGYEVDLEDAPETRLR